uniref:Secreted protein n=1 Tax=Cacopsylla melanoneura TaxID=428564 RepID=A0A8D8SDA6_9HEMI
MNSFAVFFICVFSLHNMCSAELAPNGPDDVQLRDNPYQNSSYFKTYQKKSNERHCHSMCETGCQGKEVRGCMILDHGPYKCYETGRCVSRGNANDRPVCQCQHEVPCTVRAHFEFKPDRNETVSLEEEDTINEDNDVNPKTVIIKN